MSGARSAQEVAIAPGDVALLDAFAAPADPEAVFDGRPPHARALVGELRRIGALVPAEGGGAVGTGPFADPQRQLSLLWDSLRVDAYRRALERCAAGKVLVELGCGHGVLACLAARAGARRVYAIEETSMIDVAREVARANGLDERIVFLEGNSLDVELPEPAGVVFSDLMGADPLGAGMLVYMHDAAARLLAPGGVLVPARLTLFAVGVESSRVAREADEARSWVRNAEALSETFGLDLSPLAEASRTAFARSYDDFTYKAFLDPSAGADRILTRETPVAALAVGRDDPTRAIEAALTLAVESDGTLDGMATYAAVCLDASTTLTSSPFSAETPVSWGGQFLSTLVPVDVAAGTNVEVAAEVTPWTTPAVRYRGPAPASAASLFDA